jgi:hypothetical protein
LAKHGLAEAAEHLILAIDLKGGLLMSYGQFDVFYLIRSDGLDYLVYILWCGLRKNSSFTVIGMVPWYRPVPSLIYCHR